MKYNNKLFILLYIDFYNSIVNVNKLNLYNKGLSLKAK